MKKDGKKSPFFAKFLEKQISSTEKISGGNKENTGKTTSKKDDVIAYEPTMKWPSDQDDPGHISWPTNNK